MGGWTNNETYKWTNRNFWSKMLINTLDWMATITPSSHFLIRVDPSGPHKLCTNGPTFHQSKPTLDSWFLTLTHGISPVCNLILITFIYISMNWIIAKTTLSRTVKLWELKNQGLGSANWNNLDHHVNGLWPESIFRQIHCPLDHFNLLEFWLVMFKIWVMVYLQLDRSNDQATRNNS